MRKHNKTIIVLIIAVFMLIAVPVQSGDRASQIVYFNTKTHKVHKMSCTWAKRCTRNCIRLKRSEAYKRGGVACKVCGG